MSKRPKPPLEEHPDVAPIEAILSSAAARSTRPFEIRDGRIVADRAVWLCACIYLEDCLLTPTWLAYDTADGAFGWQRLPEGQGESDVVDARVMTGDHVEPVQVRYWLEGKDEEAGFGGWWLGLSDADREVIADLGRRIRTLAA